MPIDINPIITIIDILDQHLKESQPRPALSLSTDQLALLCDCLVEHIEIQRCNYHIITGNQIFEMSGLNAISNEVKKVANSHPDTPCPLLFSNTEIEYFLLALKTVVLDQAPK